MALLLRAAVRCDVGRSRDNNEDNFYLDGTFLQREEMNAGGAFAVDASTDCALFAVCDGMGGEEKGEEASLAAVQTLDRLRDVLGDGGVHDVRALIDVYCKEANDAVYAIDGGGRAGTTFVGLCLYEDEAYCASLGDSRLYVVRDGVLEQISEDHTEAARLVRGGVLTKEEAAGSVYNNVVTNYIGMPPEETPFHTAHYTGFQLHYGDRFLLCSDGLTDMINEKRIGELLLESDAPSEAVNRLVDAALENGGRDNITALVVEVARQTQPDPDVVEDLFGDDTAVPVLAERYEPETDETDVPDSPDGLPLSFEAGESFEAPELSGVLELPAPPPEAPDTAPAESPILEAAPKETLPEPPEQLPDGVKLLFDDDSTTLDLDDEDSGQPAAVSTPEPPKPEPVDELPAAAEKKDRGLLEAELEQTDFVIVEKFGKGDGGADALLEQSLTQDGQTISYRDTRSARDQRTAAQDDEE